MFVNKSNKVDSTPSSPVNTMHPDILQLSLTIQQVSSQLNLMLSQQHLQQKYSDRATDTREGAVDLPPSIYPEHQGRPCHNTSPTRPNLFKSASHMLPPCPHHYHHYHQQKGTAPLSSSISSSLLSSTNLPISCLHDPSSWHHKYHQHYHYSHPRCLSSQTDIFRQYPYLHPTPCLCQEQQQQCRQKYHQQYPNQPAPNANNDPRSINTVPGTPIETRSSYCSNSPQPRDQTTASTHGSINNTPLTGSPNTTSLSPKSTQEPTPPIPTIKNVLRHVIKDDPSPCTELAWTDIHRQDHTTQPTRSKTKIKNSKKNRDYLLLDWWHHGKTKWHQFRNKSVSPHF